MPRPVDVGGSGPDACRHHTQRRIVAVAVHDQPSDRHRSSVAVAEVAAARRRPRSTPSTGSGLLGAVDDGLHCLRSRDFRSRGSAGVGVALIAAGIASGVTSRPAGVGRCRAPLFPVDLLRIRIFSMSIATSTVSFAAQMLAYVTLPFLFQSVLGRSAFQTGLLMTPWPSALGVVAPIAGRLADRVSGRSDRRHRASNLRLRPVHALAPRDDPSTLDIAWRMAVCGAGFGLFQSPNNRTIVSSAPRNRVGCRRRNARDREAFGTDNWSRRRRSRFPSVWCRRGTAASRSLGGGSVDRRRPQPAALAIPTNARTDPKRVRRSSTKRLSSGRYIRRRSSRAHPSARCRRAPPRRRRRADRTSARAPPWRLSRRRLMVLCPTL